MRTDDDDDKLRIEYYRGSDPIWKVCTLYLLDSNSKRDYPSPLSHFSAEFPSYTYFTITCLRCFPLKIINLTLQTRECVCQNILRPIFPIGLTDELEKMPNF